MKISKIIISLQLIISLCVYLQCRKNYKKRTKLKTKIAFTRENIFTQDIQDNIIDIIGNPAQPGCIPTKKRTNFTPRNGNQEAYHTDHHLLSQAWLRARLAEVFILAAAGTNDQKDATAVALNNYQNVLQAVTQQCTNASYSEGGGGNNARAALSMLMKVIQWNNGNTVPGPSPTRRGDNPDGDAFDGAIFRQIAGNQRANICDAQDALTTGDNATRFERFLGFWTALFVPLQVNISTVNWVFNVGDRPISVDGGLGNNACP